MKRSYGRRPFVRAANKPSRQWISINQNFAMSAAAVTTNNMLMRMEMPTDPTNLTSDPPEDIVILRVRGEFSVAMSAAATAVSWTLGLIVADAAAAGPFVSFQADADKRWLWVRTYETTADNAAFSWLPGLGQVTGANTIIGNSAGMMTELDIAPKVKLEAGKALWLVAYENVDGRTLTIVGRTMRLLYQKSRRR